MPRPPEYDRDDVLDKAMQVFWDHGYCATSMADLVEATTLKPGSIYAAFKSKERLFLAALDRYGQQSVAGIKEILDQADSPLGGIRAFFAQLAENAGQPTAKRSCFLINTVLEVARDNHEVCTHVARHLDSIEALFRRALEDARECGELAADRDPAALATFIIAGISGLRVLSVAGSSPDRVRSAVNQILSLLD